MCVQSLDSAARNLVCHHCARPAASLEAELRSRLARIGEPHSSSSPPTLPPLPAPASTRARPLCSADAAQAQRGVPRARPRGGCSATAPCPTATRCASCGGARRRAARRCSSSRAVARAVAALNELSAAVLNDEAADSAANELRALAPPWWTRDDDAARARQREALTDHASEPWQLLRAGLQLRLSEAAVARAAPLLAFETFVAVLAALEWRILALHAPEAPLGDYCRRLVRADVGTQIRATRALLAPLRRRRRGAPTPARAGADGEAQLDALLAMEAEDAAAEAPPAEGAPATVAAEVGARRRASLLSQRAAAAFEPAAFLALLPRCSSSATRASQTRSSSRRGPTQADRLSPPWSRCATCPPASRSRSRGSTARSRAPHARRRCARASAPTTPAAVHAAATRRQDRGPPSARRRRGCFSRARRPRREGSSKRRRSSAS